MSKSLLVVFGSNAVSDNTTEYNPLVGSINTGSTTTGNYDTPIRDAGTFSNLFTYVPTNTASVTSTITLQDSQVDTALTVSYTADQTGIKEDTSNTAALANTDEAQYETTVPDEAGTNTLTATLYGVEFTPDTSSDCIVILGATGSISFGNASETSYLLPGSPTNTTTIGNAKYRARFSFTSSDLYTFLSTNARTTDIVYRVMKNGANGNQSVTYTSGQTGAKEDTSNSDSFASGDDFAFSRTTGAGTELANQTVISCSCINTSGIFPLIAGLASGSAIAANTTNYFPISGRAVPAETTEADTQIYPRFTFTASELGAYVSVNAAALLATNITLRDNGGDSALTVQYLAAQTGLKNDSVNTATITTGADEIDYEIECLDLTGGITVTWIGILGSTVTEAITITTFRTLLGVGQALFLLLLKPLFDTLNPFR